MMTYDETMRYGAAQYADVIETLSARGLPSEFTQTGGMCAAIMVTLEVGYYLLLTDCDDTLAWSRDEHRGWCVGLYEPEERRTTDGPRRYGATRASSVEAVLALADEILASSGTPMRRGRETRRRPEHHLSQFGRVPQAPPAGQTPVL